MNSILLGIITTFLDSFSLGFWKKALNEGDLSATMFKIMAQIISFVFILILFFTIGFDKTFLLNTNYILLLVFMVFCSTSNYLLQSYVVKRSKLSQLLPYDNLDKLFTVIGGFILFYGTDKGVSITTLLITLLTIFVIIGFSVDIKNIKVPKLILLYICQKIIKSISTISVGYFLLKYSATTFAIGNWFLEVVFFLIMAIITKDNFKSLIGQKKSFYKNRFLASMIGWTAYFLGLLIIEKSGVVIATLLGFFGIVFSIISMKVLLNDKPEKKQIVLAILVIFLIGIGYYFK